MGLKTGVQPIIQGVPKSFKVTARVSTKIGETFYTYECCEERAINMNATVDMNAEYADIWASTCKQVEKQINDTYQLIANAQAQAQQRK